jgi:aminopeptidase N
MNAARTRAAQPSADAKAHAWQAVVEDRNIPPSMLGRVGRAFWRPGQEALLDPYAEKSLLALPALGNAGMLWALGLARLFYPQVGGGPDYLERLDLAAGAGDVSPLVRQSVREHNDRRQRHDSSRFGS